MNTRIRNSQMITIKSMLNSKACYEQYDLEKNWDIKLVAIKYAEDKISIPQSFKVLSSLSQSSDNFVTNTDNPRKLPLLNDIIKSVTLLDPKEEDIIVYSNIDIILHKSFYIFLTQEIQHCNSIIINRKDIIKDNPNNSKKEYTINDLPNLYKLKGTIHPGYDCFAFPYNMVSKLSLGKVFLGYPPVGSVLKKNLVNLSQKINIYKDVNQTFHIGNDENWRTENLTNNEYYKANLKFAQEIDFNFKQLEMKDKNVSQNEEGYQNRIKESYSQIGQDLWVIDILDGKRNGIFVEIGAANGIELSNTYLLEKRYNWQGICVEPSRQFEYLSKNRKCIVDNRVVFDQDGKEVIFVEDYTHGNQNWFSGIKESLDHHKSEGKETKKKTISINSLLNEHKISTEIDFLSIDTEGSEYEIIQGINFEKWKINLIAVETNNVEPKQSNIFKLLSANGYIRVHHVDTYWDDWYYHHTLIPSMNDYFDKVDSLMRKTLKKSQLNTRELKLSKTRCENESIKVSSLKKELSRVKEQLQLARKNKDIIEKEKLKLKERLIEIHKSSLNKS